MEAAAVILAAGKGTRMKSGLPKVLHLVGGEPLVLRVLRTAKRCAQRVVVVVGYRAEEVRRVMEGTGVLFAEQRELLGTGHALRQAEAALQGFTGAVIVLSGDVPLITVASISRLLDLVRSGAAAALLTAECPSPRGYGRIIRGPGGQITGIMEEKDASPAQRLITEINGGVYGFDSRYLWDTLRRITPDNEQREYYLPDAVNLLIAGGHAVTAVKLNSMREISGVNTVEELEKLNAALAAGEV